MADEPDNVMLRWLREIRGELQDVRVKQDEHDRRFDKLAADVEELRSWVMHALGVTTTQFLEDRDQREHAKQFRGLEDTVNA